MRFLSCLFLAVLWIPSAGAADVAGSGDHPLLKRVQGAEIFFQKATDFERLKLALGKLEWSGAEMKVKDFPSAVVEGKLTTTYYEIPAGIGTLEVQRNYEQELREGGFEILFSALGQEVETVGYNNQIAREVLRMTGTYGSPEERAQWPFQHTKEESAGYIAAKKSTPDGDVFASVYIVENTHPKWLDRLAVGQVLARVDVLEVKARDQRMELVTGAQMQNEIALNGRVALYGIQFDFDSAAIRPESDATLAEVAKLLDASPALRILVVGHTDASGGFRYNLDLSQKRAESVVANLTAKGVARDRLFPVGVGFAAPIASNLSEDGRAKNRRVELVDLAGGRAD